MFYNLGIKLKVIITALLGDLKSMLSLLQKIHKEEVYLINRNYLFPLQKQNKLK